MTKRLAQQEILCERNLKVRRCDCMIIKHVKLKIYNRSSCVYVDLRVFVLYSIENVHVPRVLQLPKLVQTKSISFFFSLNSKFVISTVEVVLYSFLCLQNPLFKTTYPDHYYHLQIVLTQKHLHFLHRKDLLYIYFQQ